MREHNLNRKKSLVFIFIFFSGASFMLFPFFYEYSFIGMSANPPERIVINNKYSIELWEVDYYRNNYSKNYVLFPLGRPIPNKSIVHILLNNEEIHIPIVSDGYGGYWANFSFERITKNSILVIKITHYKTQSIPFSDEDINSSKWIEPSPCIDSNNETLRKKAYTLTQDCRTTSEKAKVLNRFVKQYLEYDDNPYLPEIASLIYQTRKGRCRHHAHLFVALSRSINIPARTITGRLIQDSSLFWDLHQWAEFMDEEGLWHPVDPTAGFFNFSDTRFFDFFYAIKQNSFDPYEMLHSDTPSLTQGYGTSTLEEVVLSDAGLIELSVFMLMIILINLGFAFIIVELLIIIKKRVTKQKIVENTNTDCLRY